MTTPDLGLGRGTSAMYLFNYASTINCNRKNHYLCSLIINFSQKIKLSLSYKKDGWIFRWVLYIPDASQSYCDLL